ncbi:hypothetical protein FO519_008205 [Halicephalobus sp. NKZ332]|nr:hypothetical protein FO519_008205 [Halicephalobus sp. NKZ332]
MNFYSEDPDLDAVNLIPEIDKAAEQKKFKQSMKYFDFVALIAHALLAYRIHRHEIKLLSKFIHVAFHILALCAAGVGFAAMLEFKNAIKLQHFYSFHAWIGGGLILFYILQFIAGFVNYAFPKTSITVRKSVMPYHRGFGKILLGVSVAQVLSGQAFYYDQHFGAYEGAKFGKACQHNLDCPDHLDIIYNFSILGVIIYAALVYILVSKEDWMRRPTPDEIKQD